MRTTSPAKGKCLRCMHQGASSLWLTSPEAHIVHSVPTQTFYGWGLEKLLSSGVEGRVNPAGWWGEGWRQAIVGERDVSGLDA